jgi:protein O-mannosyl-transferase
VRRPILLIVLVAAASYWNSLSSPFILDDRTSILDNATIQTLTLPGPLLTPSDTPVARRPLVNLSFAINYALAGYDVRGFHLVNLLIHVLAALTLFGIVRRTLLLPALAPRFGEAATLLGAACALIWLLHPLNSEIVNYVTQRSEGMLGLAFLLTLYCAIRSATAPRSRGWTAVAIGCCAAGMLCKESMIGAPIAVLLYDRVFLFDTWSALRLRARLYAGLCSCWLLLGAMMMLSARTSAGFGTAVTPWDYLLNQAVIIPRYLSLALWPRALVVDYGMTRPIPLEVAILPGLLVLLAAGIIIAALFRWPRAAFAGAWFFVTLAPTSSFVPIATEVAAERRMYLPLAALVVLVVLSAYRLAMLSRATRAALPATAAVICVLLAAGTMRRNWEYQDPVRLAETVVERHPSGRGYATLGTLYMDHGETDRAIRQFRRAATIYPPGHYVLGVALVDQQRFDEGLAELYQFVRLAPRHDAVTGARDLIGRVLMTRRDYEGASRQFEQLLAERPLNIRAMILLADVRLAQGRIAEAIALYERGYREDSGVGRDSAVMRRFGTALASVNRLAEAEHVFARGAAAAPRDPGLQKLWGRALAAQGRYAAAAERFRQAAALAPRDEEALTLAAAIERQLGSAHHWR